MFFGLNSCWWKLQMLRLFTHTFCADNWESFLPTWWLSRRRGEWCPKYVHCLQVCQAPYIAQIQIAHNLFAVFLKLKSTVDFALILTRELYYDERCLFTFAISSAFRNQSGPADTGVLLSWLPARSRDEKCNDSQSWHRLRWLSTQISLMWYIHCAGGGQIKWGRCRYLGTTVQSRCKPSCKKQPCAVALCRDKCKGIIAKLVECLCKGHIDGNSEHSWQCIFFHAM